ncbi:flagellar motor protein [Clostridium sp. 19966]|uniref:flagellar motor protein n=1 Tax=Clostridium sp. 19966 TaxID=2768166 RepID=UPI0028E050CC|nr:flagellar motor protein [Clostridium sp. 19966]MDT8719503.1 flagellar motor protein [Clostridium sp. 19966]
MDISSIGFMIFSFVALIGAFLLEGGALSGLLGLPPAMIVFGGTLGAVGASFPLAEIKRAPKMIGVMLKPKKVNLVELIIFFRDVSYKTRKNGLLSIESEVLTSDIDPFLKKGLQLVVDGVEPETIQGVLEMDIEMTSERHKKGAAVFASAGGYAPTMGIIGTVMGLVHILADLSEPATLGPKIASGFIATLYGISSANLIWLPIANKLKALDSIEYNEKSLMMEAILLIQSGTNPNTLVEKLKGFLDKKQVAELEAAGKGSEQ